MVDRDLASLAEQREQRRRDLLLLVYKLVHGNQFTRLPHEEVRAAAKLDQDEYNELVIYLAKEGLLDHTKTSMALSHAGIVRAEQLLKGDEHRTGQVAIVQQTFHARVGAVQNAPGSSTVVQQASTGDVKEARMDGRDETVFISCGQSTEKERDLGATISELVATLTPFKPYFAEQQSTLAGLTQNTFGGLNRAVGFIAVMHHRGAVTPDGRVRASVWIEQEIAIAAFLEQTLGRSLHVLAYSQKGIALEGVRSQLLLNPIEFEQDDDVVKHLRKVLPTWRAVAQQPAGNPFNMTLKYEKVKITGERHDYRVCVMDVGKVREGWFSGPV